MHYTEEQNKILEATGDLKISALAGSGKTSTLMAIAEKNRDKKILYLAFNRSVRDEASARFKQKGLSNVQIETAHSLAFREVVRGKGYQVASYTVSTFSELMDSSFINNKEERDLFVYFCFKLFNVFCNSSERKVKDINLYLLSNQPQTLMFLEKYEGEIIKAVRGVLNKMDKKIVDVSHDFYLKKYQLAEPLLNYDIILFDEGQDASASMLEVFLNQKAQKIIVGDSHQQIYAWRGAVNSLEKIDFPEYFLSGSFRLNENMATLANNVLDWKEMVTETQVIGLKGLAKKHEQSLIESRATLARTNVVLLEKAIKFIHQNPRKGIFFEGNFNSYVYSDMGSIFDILNLFLGNFHLIKNKIIASMRSVEEFEAYILKVEDVSSKVMLSMVKEYKKELPVLIEQLREKQVAKDKAAMIFSTLHKAKGMEYDKVEICHDFLTEKRFHHLFDEWIQSFKSPHLSLELIQEINLLYVALTRVKKKVVVPKGMFENSFDFQELTLA